MSKKKLLLFWKYTVYHKALWLFFNVKKNSSLLYWFYLKCYTCQGLCRCQISQVLLPTSRGTNWKLHFHTIHIPSIAPGYRTHPPWPLKNWENLQRIFSEWPSFGVSQGPWFSFSHKLKIFFSSLSMHILTYALFWYKYFAFSFVTCFVKRCN